MARKKKDKLGRASSRINMELRHGLWQDVLYVETADVLISDNPFGPRTHKGQKVSSYNTEERYARTAGLGYDCWTPEDVSSFIAAWSPRIRGWMACFTSHDLIPAYEEAFETAGRYVFAPISCMQHARNVRLAGDGPASWTDHLMVARPRNREFARWGALRGGYHGAATRSESGVPEPLRRLGGKPLWLMRALVRDYSKPGDLIVDPCAGSATTLIAAGMEGRRALGAEMDRSVFEDGLERISHGYTRCLPGLDEAPHLSQGCLFSAE